jgi:hypothetical protein
MGRNLQPAHMKEVEAEETESIVHIHFDAKYKVDYFYKSKAYNNQSESSEEEEISTNELDELKSVEALEDSGTFKDIDLYKMHAYKDAIRRSGGAYILYPGSPDGNNVFQGYHEIIPGVGAFALRPSNESQAIQSLQVFISDIIDNLSDVISQRERLAKTKYEIIKDKPIKFGDTELVRLAHQIGLSESIDETYVLVGYCKSNNSHFNWISKNKKYNIRFGLNYQVDGKMATAKYLILYEKINGEVTFRDNVIFEIDSASTRLISKTDLINLQYPSTPNADSYLLYELINEIPLGQYKFSFDDRIKYLKEQLIKNSDRELPFAISIADLLKVRVK